MKRILFILLLTIPFIGFGQVITNNGWKIYHEYNDGSKENFIILFEKNSDRLENDSTQGQGTFIQHAWYEGHGFVINCSSSNWTVNGNKVMFEFNNGHQIFSGKINRKGNYMSGTSISIRGMKGSWKGEIIKF